MKNKIIFTFIFIIILSTIIVFLVFLGKKGSSFTSTSEPGLELKNPNEQAINNPVTQPHKEVIQPQYMNLDTDYFALTLPSGWEMTSEDNTLPITIVDSKEAVLDEKAREIDFRTNLSIKWTELGENSLKDYFEAVKISLINSIPIIEIIKEEQTLAGDKEAYFMEIKSVQKNLKFGTFVALVAGQENTAWAFSFNTLEESWIKYKEIFYQTIKGLRMK
ncbi:MAG: hypothetical protein HYV47_00635 [Candidatus Nealsonbacteria bacterium]|nr:hypothetical protein [Candidatus Nealsonbacteria bacterium]